MLKRGIPQTEYTLPHPQRNVTMGSVRDKLCIQPETMLLPTADAAGAWRSSDGWILGEDGAHNQKPGWWLDSHSGGSITFTLQVRKAKPLVGILFLTSYENMGRVEFFLD